MPIRPFTRQNPFPPRHFRRKQGKEYRTTHTRALLDRLRDGRGHFTAAPLPPGQCLDGTFMDVGVARKSGDNALQ
ncbi:hypothetical protein [Caulifigura coniformis]|nr:hypothetical protein [Caulifigura coniformis]